MGPSYTAAYRYMIDKASTPTMEKTVFDPYLVGMKTTYPEDEHQNITDSASAATTMSAAVKTYNAAIAVDNDQTEVKTVLEQAKENGMSTGLVATSEITHATPAAYGAHDISRKNMDAIAKVLLQNIKLKLTAAERASVKKAAESKDATTIDNAIEAIFNARSFNG